MKKLYENMKNITKISLFLGLSLSGSESVFAVNGNILQNENEKNEKIENKNNTNLTGKIFVNKLSKDVENHILSFIPEKEKSEIKSEKRNIKFQEIVNFFHNSTFLEMENKGTKFMNIKDRVKAFNLTRKELKKQIEEKYCYVNLDAFRNEKTLILENKSKNTSNKNILSENIDIENPQDYKKNITPGVFFESKTEFLFALFFYQETENSEYEQLMPLRLSVSSENDLPKLEKLLKFFHEKLNTKNNKIENDDSLSFDFGIKLDFTVDIEFLQDDEFVKKYKKNISSLCFQQTFFCSKKPIYDKDLKTLSEMNFANLIELNLSGCEEITNEGLSYLKDMKSLQRLNLCWFEEITDADLANLNGLVNLKELNLRGCKKIKNAGLANLNGLVNLQTLDLRSCEEITDAGLANLKSLVNLKDLNLDGCKKITDAGLANLKDLVNLQTLHLHDCSIITTSVGLANLKNLKNLQTLNLPNCEKITDASLASLLINSPKLNDFSFDWSSFVIGKNSENNMKIILDWLIKNKKLKKIKVIGDIYRSDRNLTEAMKCYKIAQKNGFFLDYFRNCNDEDLEYIVKEFPNLQKLNLKNCIEITDAGLAHLKGLVNLKELNLAECKEITKKGLLYLKDMKSLQTLNLFACQEIKDAGLAHLKNLENLRYLNLVHLKKIKDTGLAHLKDLKSLQTLNLCWCDGITDVGLAHLKDLKNLRELDLSHCEEITNDGLAHLKDLKNLQTLHLGYCEEITDEGLAHLKDLVNLKELYLHYCRKITNDGKEMLRKEIPGLSIFI